MISELRARLAARETQAAFAELAVGAPVNALLSLEIDLPGGSTDWLDYLPADDCFWFHARPAQGEFRLGIGHALHWASHGEHRFTALDQAFAGLRKSWVYRGRPQVFAGFAFAPDSSGPLPNALLAVPSLLLNCTNGRCSAVLSTPAGQLAAAPGHWSRLLAHRPVGTLPRHSPASGNPLAEQAWQARVQAALRDIAAGRLDKVVLSRSRQIEAATPIPAAGVLARLIERQSDSLVYAYGNGHQTFLGATPEQLLSLRAGRVSADALAGTAWQGSAPLDAGKNRHEQALVTRAIIDALQAHCTDLPRATPAVPLAASHLSHLRSRIEATARPASTLFELVQAVHPTPAVGGFPRQAASDWLRAHGEQRQAWYSGGIGLLAPDGDGEFAVALRCALLDGCRAELQAGAGIVAGSDAENEQREIDAKLDILLGALAPDEMHVHGRSSAAA